MWRRIRIVFLLLVLVFVAVDQWLSQRRAADWGRTLHVVIYPIDGDGRPATRAYLAALGPADFDEIEGFLEQQAGHYGIGNPMPVIVDLAPEVVGHPPEIPAPGSVWRAIGWSLEMRYWAWRVGDYDGPRPDVRLFVSYYDPESTPRLDHSAGLRKGMIGAIKVFASRQLAARNRVVITHELMHTLGATDHYDLANNQPIYPDGYADPDQVPLYPQRRAEIMGGRIPLSATRSVIPPGLARAVVGAKTAREIHWVE